jgi:hypothetical protein
MESATHAKDQDATPNVAGDPRSTKSTILETGAAMTQAGPPRCSSQVNITQNLTVSRTSHRSKTSAPILTPSMSTPQTPSVSSRRTTTAAT